MPSLRVALATALLLACAASPAASGDDVDPWQGKHRSEVVAWLGEPDKVKRKDGVESLTYRVVRLADDALPAADLRVIDLPGIGRLGRKLDGPPVGDDTLTIEPTEVDRRGGARTGGVTTSRSRSVSRSDDGEVRADPPLAGVPAGTKLKLRFELDASGRVTSWSVDGAKKR